MIHCSARVQKKEKKKKKKKKYKGLTGSKAGQVHFKDF